MCYASLGAFKRQQVYSAGIFYEYNVFDCFLEAAGIRGIFLQRT